MHHYFSPIFIFMPRSIQEQIQRIQSAHRLGLITHLVMGYPSLEETRQRVMLMAKHGVDCIELQIPFSDPLADGSTITRANQAAVAHGITTQACLDLLAELSRQVDIPLIVVSYYNTILRYGTERFVSAAAQAGCAGFIIPDLPITEYEHEPLYTAAQSVHRPIIQLVTPLTSNDRLRQIARYADGFVYCVSRFGVTGKSTVLSAELEDYLRRVRKYVTLPIAVGFGIRTPEHIQQLRGAADLVIIGSALMEIPTDQLANHLRTLCASL